jgi:hypothetical protein
LQSDVSHRIQLRAPIEKLQPRVSLRVHSPCLLAINKSCCRCAIVYQGGKHNILFASQLNPDILVALTEKDKDKDWELTIWEKGQVRATLPFEGCKGFDLLNWRVDFLEHCTEVQGVKRHWFGRLTKDAKYVFIDLNDLKTVKSIEAPAAQCLAWVPNEST